MAKEKDAPTEDKSSVGRPTKFTDAVAAKIVGLIKKGRKPERIAEIIGISERTLAYWVETKEEFSQLVREAKIDADELVIASLFQKAVGFRMIEEKAFCTRDGDIKKVKIRRHLPPDTSAIALWLRNRKPKEWQRGPNDIVINPALGKDDADLDKRINELLEKKMQGELGDKTKDPEKK